MKVHYLQQPEAAPAWMQEAACQYTDPDLFFASETGSGRISVLQAQQAVRVCRSCPVIAECLRWAFQVEDKHAVLGGMTPEQRTRLKKKVRGRAS